MFKLAAKKKQACAQRKMTSVFVSDLWECDIPCRPIVPVVMAVKINTADSHLTPVRLLSQAAVRDVYNFTCNGWSCTVHMFRSLHCSEADRDL